MKLSEILAQREKKKKSTEEKSFGQRVPMPVTSASAKKSVIKVVRTRETPNPDALQFVINSVILSRGNKSYSSQKDCDGDGLGQAIFALEGIASVYVMDNFVTVTKDGSVEWTPLRDQVWKAIDSNVTIYPSADVAGKAQIDVENFPALSNEDKLKAIEMVLDRSIRSNLAQDGGGVELKGIDGNVVRILYQGACGSCATSTSGTLKFIQGQLRQQLHSDLEVKAV